MHRRAALVLPALLLLAACQAPAPRAEMAVMPPANLAPPGRVLVSGFTGPSRGMQDQIANTVVRDIGSMGLPSDRVGRPNVTLAPGDLIVDGQMTGRNAARVTVSLVRGQPAAPVLLKTFDNETAAVPAGGRAARRAGEALGHRIAADLGAFFAQEGWIPAAPTSGRPAL